MARKFEALVNETGLDDGGVASFTFMVDVLIKGKIYEEHHHYNGMPSGFIIDDNGCWNKISNDESFLKRFKEVTT